MQPTIVFCCDGTANKEGETNIHVVHLLRHIPTTVQHITAYEPGSGTSSPLGMIRHNPIGTTLG